MHNTYKIALIFILFYLLLYFKIQTFTSESVQLEKTSIFCIILTTSNNLKTKASISFNSWAYKCDNYTFVTVIPQELASSKRIAKDNSSGNLEILDGFYMLQPKELQQDLYSRLTEKVLWAFAHVFRVHRKYGWYIKADDDSFIHVDNLRRFLADKNPQTGVTYGFDFSRFVVGGYQSGGGYVLSNRAFSKLGEKLVTGISFCQNSGIEDIDVAACLRTLDVYSNSSLDSFGRERFHTLTLLESYRGDFPKWLKERASNPLRAGLNCCSDSWISFHHLPPKQIYQLSRIVDGLSDRTYAQPDVENNAFRDVVDAMSKFVYSTEYSSFEPPQIF